jgi:AcrR family transcriptional regulator/DNA-binding MarR family transcriptional regulator
MGEEQQRTRILRALADELAAREDPNAVTVAQVLARAGTSRRAFYELYADREECFLAAFEWGLVRAGEAMYAAYARESRWHDGVRAALVELLALLEDEPALATLCIVYAPGAGPRVLQRRLQALEVLREFVDRGRLEGSGRAEPPEVAAEGAVGAVLAVLHTRLLRNERSGLMELLGPLMSVILLPYMGAVKAGRELTRPAPRRVAAAEGSDGGPTQGVEMRLTYRTTRVLSAIAERPGASNREVADSAGIVDQGQISKLLGRLENLGLIENALEQGRGSANAWVLSPRGERVERGIRQRQREVSS